MAPSTPIDASALAQRGAGLTASAAHHLPGWGRRWAGGSGWYLELPPRAPTVLIRVLEVDDPRRTRTRPDRRVHRQPAQLFGRGLVGGYEEEWIDERRAMTAIAIPDADGRFLAPALGGRRHPLAATSLFAAPPHPGELASDPIFLAAAVVCEDVPAMDATDPSHEGRLGTHEVLRSRTVQDGCRAVLAAAEPLVGHRGPWGGTLRSVAARAATLLTARYDELALRGVAGVLQQTVAWTGATDLPDGTLGDDHDLLDALWRPWSFGTQRDLAHGLLAVQAARPQPTEHEVAALLLRLLVAMHLGLATAASDPVPPPLAGHAPAPPERSQPGPTTRAD